MSTKSSIEMGPVLRIVRRMAAKDNVTRGDIVRKVAEMADTSYSTAYFKVVKAEQLAGVQLPTRERAPSPKFDVVKRGKLIAEAVSKAKAIRLVEEVGAPARAVEHA